MFNQKHLIILVVLGVAYYLCTRSTKESFTEIFGNAGYKTPVLEVNIDYDSGESTNGFKLNTSEGISSDEVSVCAVQASNLILNKTGLCSTIIENNKMQVFTNDQGDKLFKCRFMFMITSTNFPFGISMNVEVLNGKIIKGTTQPLRTDTKVAAYTDMMVDNFLPASDLLAKPKYL